MIECRCKYNRKIIDGATRKIIKTEVREGILVNINTDHYEFENCSYNLLVAVIITDDGKIDTPSVSEVFDIQHPMLKRNNL